MLPNTMLYTKIPKTKGEEGKTKRVVHTVVASASCEQSNAKAMAVVRSREYKAGRITAFWIRVYKSLPQYPGGMKVHS